MSEEDYSYIEQEKEEDDRHFLINLIDSQSHADYVSEATPALRVSDGALFVVNCLGGFNTKQYLLRQAIAERVKPILFMDQMDRAFLAIHFDSENIYQTLWLWWTNGRHFSWPSEGYSLFWCW